jgi:hypothetical protein
MEVNMRRENDNGSASSEEEALDEPYASELEALTTSDKKNPQFCRNLTIATIPIAAILMFMSRPIVGYLSREICYYMQDEPPIPGYNPVNWVQWAWHGTSSLYKCEWLGHWGFNWLSIMQWLSDKGTSIFTSLGVLGGSYATWKSVTTWLKKKTMTNDDKGRLRELARHIHVKETEGEGPNLVSFTDGFTNTLRFSPLASPETTLPQLSAVVVPSTLHNPSHAPSHAPSHDPGRKMPSALSPPKLNVNFMV